MNKTNFPSGEDYTLNRSLMVIGAHADDNEISCGGTMLKYRDLGYDIIYVQSTNNMSGQWQELDDSGNKRLVAKAPPAEMQKRRQSECDAAAKVLDTTPIHLNHPQRHYNGPGEEQIKLTYGSDRPGIVPPNTPTILTAYEDAASVERLTKLILETDPEIIFTHGLAAGNIEHYATSLFVITAYWKAVDQGYKGGLLTWYERILRLGASTCRWDTFIDYTPFLDRKMELIHCHYCQMPNALDPNFGHRRFANWYGNLCGCGAAEAFFWVNRPAHRNAFGPVYPELTMELIQNSR